MAGRGTDINLGGNAEYMAKHEMARQGFTDELIAPFLPACATISASFA